MFIMPNQNIFISFLVCKIVFVVQFSFWNKVKVSLVLDYVTILTLCRQCITSLLYIKEEEAWGIFQRNAGIGISFISMCQMAPSILFQWTISNFNAPFDKFNVPKKSLIRSMFLFLFCFTDAWSWIWSLTPTILDYNAVNFVRVEDPLNKLKFEKYYLDGYKVIRIYNIFFS